MNHPLIKILSPRTFSQWLYKPTDVVGNLLCSHWTEGPWLALQRKETSTATYDASNNGLKQRPEMILFQLRYSLGFPVRSR